jgi:hypothetical protein
MSDIQNIRQTDLTPSEREILAADIERWKRLGAGAHLDDWLAFGPGLMIRRRLAMNLANTNEPVGRAYCTHMARLMAADGLHTMDGQGKVNPKRKNVAISCVLWFHENASRLEIRSTMTVGERARLNSPITARQRVEKILKVREGGEAEPKVRVSPMSKLKGKVEDLTRNLAHANERLASAERDGSLFDLKHDSVEDIARVFVDTVSVSKAKKIVAAIQKLLKAATPAG